eukprot:IDg16676t1
MLTMISGSLLTREILVEVHFPMILANYETQRVLLYSYLKVSMKNEELIHSIDIVQALL